METFLQDIRYGLRMIAKSPGFTAIAILTLALGIGANTALFSVVNGVLLNPLPYPNPEQLVALGEKTPIFSESSIAYPNFLDWVKMNHTFEALAAYRGDVFNLTGSGEAQRLKAVQISASFFPLLGVKPAIGRDFTPEENKQGAAPVVMLSGALWKSNFGGSPNVLGKMLTLDGTGYTIVGVVPGNFTFCCESMNFEPGDIYVPIGLVSASWLTERTDHPGIRAIGRLKAGVTLKQARADMEAVARNLAAAYPDSNKTSSVAMTQLKDRMVQDVAPILFLLLAAVGFVLLIACANVANLLLARATARGREFAIRAALGATQSRVVRQLLTESLLLAIAGGILGLLIALWGTHAALKVLPEALPRANEVHMDSRVLFFTLAVSILAGVLFGLAPALKTSRPRLHETLKEGGRGASGARHRTQAIFVVVELAMAVVLLVGAGLTIRSLARLWEVNPGFDPHNVLTFSLALPPSIAKQSPDQIRAALHQLSYNIGQIPGVTAVSIQDGAQPMSGDDETAIWIDGQPKPATNNEMPETLHYIVGPDYLKAMRVPLLRGRFLSESDNPHSPLVGVIDENFAREYFPGVDPIGRRIHLGYKDQPIEIVGVVGHVKQWGLDETVGPVKIQLYMLAEQMPDEWMTWMGKGAGFVVRTQTPTFASADGIRSALQKMNSEQVAFDFMPMDQIVAESLAVRRFAMILLSAFAAIALLLASIGIYGVISYVTSQRTHEIGIRIALGALRSDVLRLILGEGARMALIGVAVGIAGSLALTRLMAKLLFGVSAYDPFTFLAVGGLLMLVALAACYVPARRAMRVDPMVALRYE